MGGIGQNLQLQSDSSEIVCAITAPHKTYACQILRQTKYVIFCELWEKISVPDITNLGLNIQTSNERVTWVSVHTLSEGY